MMVQGANLTFQLQNLQKRERETYCIRCVLSSIILNEGQMSVLFCFVYLAYILVDKPIYE